MMKKLLAMLLALLTVATLSACSDKKKEENNSLDSFKKVEVVYTSADVKVTFADQTEGTATVFFESVTSETVTITGYKGPDRLHTLTIPTQVQTGEDETTIKRVDSISDVAFYSVSALAAVTVPEGVTAIGEYSFAKCVQLESVTLPATLKTMGEGAFMGSALKTLPLPTLSALTEISDSAFAACTGLTEVTVPAYIKTVGKGAFADCTAIHTVVLSEGVEILKDQAFQNTTALKSITLPSTFTNTDPLEDFVFWGSRVIEEITTTCPATAEAAASIQAYVDAMTNFDGTLTFPMTEGK